VKLLKHFKYITVYLFFLEKNKSFVSRIKKVVCVCVCVCVFIQETSIIIKILLPKYVLDINVYHKRIYL